MEEIEKLAKEVIEKKLDLIETAIENRIDPLLLEYHTALLGGDMQKAERLKTGIDEKERSRKELEDELRRLGDEIGSRKKHPCMT